LDFVVVGTEIRDLRWIKKTGSGIRDKHPRPAILLSSAFYANSIFPLGDIVSIEHFSIEML
jgi:hypothetical protein